MPIHNIRPLYDKDSRILILGSFPSVKSRETAFFYAHPQNRFWKIAAALFREDIPVTVEEKKKLLLNNHVALWDVIASCDIKGSSDASISNIKVNDLRPVLEASRISRIFCNGSTADRLYRRYLFEKTGIEAARLPSSSPANAAYSLEKLIDSWKVILKDDY